MVLEYQLETVCKSCHWIYTQYPAGIREQFNPHTYTYRLHPAENPYSTLFALATEEYEYIDLVQLPMTK